MLKKREEPGYLFRIHGSRGVENKEFGSLPGIGELDRTVSNDFNKISENQIAEQCKTGPAAYWDSLE